MSSLSLNPRSGNRAVGRCKECGKEISSRAKSCPNCGARPSQVTKTSIGCGLVAGASFVAVIIVLNRQPLPSSPDDELAAFSCGGFIKQTVRDPSSVEWITEPALAHAIKQSDGSYRAILVLRANNGFGGKSVSNFSCTVSKDDAGNWRLLNLTES